MYQIKEQQYTSWNEIAGENSQKNTLFSPDKNTKSKWQKYGLEQLYNLGSPVYTKTRQFQSIRINVE